MAIIKSFSVGDGDMFYINHGSDNFTIIDCNYIDEYQRDTVFGEVKTLSSEKGIIRFISTHPDEDHIHGLEKLDDMIGILNFYVVKNQAVKDVETDSFRRYKKLRDDTKKAYYVYKDCKRKWMNLHSDDNDKENRGAAGINFLWPDTSNEYFVDSLENVKKGFDFNNISPIFTYSLSNGIKAMWMGDMETTFLEKIQEDIPWPQVDVLFAPHHGRKSGHVSSYVLDKLSPQIIVIGEAPAKDLDYYSEYDTIKQNSAGNITFICNTSQVDVYVENINYSYDIASLSNYGFRNNEHGKYLGTFIPYEAK